jgi:hypothetical protein
MCSTTYDKAAIESRLVAALQSRLKEFALQDHTCTKCKQVGGLPEGNGNRSVEAQGQTVRRCTRLQHTG